MIPSAADQAIEKACGDIDRYISEMSRPRQEGQPLSPSQRLRALGHHQVGSSLRQDPAVEEPDLVVEEEMSTPLLPNEF